MVWKGELLHWQTLPSVSTEKEEQLDSLKTKLEAERPSLG